MALPKYKNFQNYLLTYLVIGFCGIPFFDAWRVANMAFFLVLAFMFFYYKKKLDKELFILVAIAIYLVLFQTLYFGGGKLVSTITMISLLILSPYFAIKLIGPRFLKYFRDIMIVIALISIGFWIGVNLSPGLHNAAQGWGQALGQIYKPDFGMYNENFIIYTYEKHKVYGIIRNPGPFHEPGAFSVFLILAIISEIFITGKLYTKYNLLFILNIISSFSTAGFIGMFIILGFYIYSSHRMTMLTKFFVSGSLVAILIYMFMTLDFLSEKISSQMEEQTEAQLNSPTSGRFLGARKAIIVLYRYPLYGRGLISASKASTTSDEAAHYGWITWVSQLGIIFGVFYMFQLYKVLRNYSIVNLHSRLFALFAFLALLAVLSGQKHTNTVLFFGLFLVPLLFPLSKYSSEYKINE